MVQDEFSLPAPVLTTRSMNSHYRLVFFTTRSMNSRSASRTDKNQTFFASPSSRRALCGIGTGTQFRVQLSVRKIRNRVKSAPIDRCFFPSPSPSASRREFLHTLLGEGEQNPCRASASAPVLFKLFGTSHNSSLAQATLTGLYN